MIDLLSIFSRVKTEEYKTFFIGESVSILPEYYRATNANTFETPIYGWNIESISGTNATLVRGNIYTTQKIAYRYSILKTRIRE